MAMDTRTEAYLWYLAAANLREHGEHAAADLALQKSAVENQQLYPRLLHLRAPKEGHRKTA